MRQSFLLPNFSLRFAAKLACSQFGVCDKACVSQFGICDKACFSQFALCGGLLLACIQSGICNKTYSFSGWVMRQDLLVLSMDYGTKLSFSQLG